MVVEPVKIYSDGGGSPIDFPLRMGKSTRNWKTGKNNAPLIDPDPGGRFWKNPNDIMAESDDEWDAGVGELGKTMDDSRFKQQNRKNKKTGQSTKPTHDPSRLTPTYIVPSRSLSIVMNFTKTKLYQRTRSCYEKFYLDFNRKKVNGRRSGGTPDGVNTKSSDVVDPITLDEPDSDDGAEDVLSYHSQVYLMELDQQHHCSWYHTVGGAVIAMSVHLLMVKI